MRDSYTVVFNGAAIEDDTVFLKLYTEFSGTLPADPSSSPSYPDLKNLLGLFSADVAGTTESVTWNGYFSEQGALDQNSIDAPLPYRLDGFNYVVSGSGIGSI